MTAERPIVRMDKWLWAARFFKTRGLASKACDLGRIYSNEVKAKPARDVHVGDVLRVENEGGVFQIEVLLLSQMRGPAVVARTLYRETQTSREARLKLAVTRGGCANALPRDPDQSRGTAKASRRTKGHGAIRASPGSQTFQARPEAHYSVSRWGVARPSTCNRSFKDTNNTRPGALAGPWSRFLHPIFVLILRSELTPAGAGPFLQLHPAARTRQSDR